MSNAARAIVVIPTYNERENIGPLLRAVLAAEERLDALVVDDDSPDGTARVAQELARTTPRVQILVRYRDRGRGSAGREGFLECLRLGYGLICEMDADFSHNPADIPRLLAAAQDADVVIGSRLVAGGSEEGRTWARTLVTLLASAYLRLALGVPRVRDCTSGFRCFRREALEQANVASLRSRGPSIVTELLFRCRRLRIREVPIDFRDRRAGRSKFSFRAMRDSLILPWLMRRRGQ